MSNMQTVTGAHESKLAEHESKIVSHIDDHESHLRMSQKNADSHISHRNFSEPLFDYDSDVEIGRSIPNSSSTSGGTIILFFLYKPIIICLNI